MLGEGDVAYLSFEESSTLNVLRRVLPFAFLLVELSWSQFASCSQPGSPTPIATHILVVFPADAKRPSDAKLLKILKKVPAQDWSVSVTRSDGSITPYSPIALLKGNLGLAPSTRPLNDETNGPVENAAKELEGFPGRRILIVVLSGNRHSSPSPNLRKPASMFKRSIYDRLPSWIVSLEEAGVAAYVVDGGYPVEKCYDVSWDAYSRGPSPEGCDHVYKRERYTSGGIVHEIKLTKAVADAIRKMQSVQ